MVAGPNCLKTLRIQDVSPAARVSPEVSVPTNGGQCRPPCESYQGCGVEHMVGSKKPLGKESTRTLGKPEHQEACMSISRLGSR